MSVSSQLLQPGTIGVIPTDTVYGVVARAVDQSAVSRLYQLKHRHSKPGTIIAASIDQLVELGIKRRYLTAAAQWWPGPVSVVIPCCDELAYLHQGVHSLAVRIPDSPALQEILAQTGSLLTTSANFPGQPPAITVSQAQNYFTNEVDFYGDGGDLSGHLPSTVVRIIDDAIEVLRQGAVKINPDTGAVQQ